MAVIAPPTPTLRPWGLLVQEAYRIDVDGLRWREGITFHPLGPDGFGRAEVEFCIPDSGTYTDDPFTVGEAPTFKAFHIVGTEECSALDVDRDYLEGRLNTRAMVLTSEQIAAELLSGTESPSLSDTAAAVTNLSTAEVVPTLDAAAATLLHGAQGLIHLSPALFATIVGDHAEKIGDSWFSPSGHRFVFDAGYAEMDNGDSGDPGGVAYLTGPVGIHIGEPRFGTASAVEYLNRTRNEITARHEAEAIFAFDPETVAAVGYDYDSGYNPAIGFGYA